jgi:predicted transposase YbfD/YdcC
MGEQVRVGIKEHFRDLKDPRVERCRRHNLLDIIVIAVCGVICGADNWVDIAEFGRSRAQWLATFLELPNGIPSHDTFGRVFARLDADAFQACFMAWAGALREAVGGEVVALDGKTLRGSYNRSAGLRAAHVISAWAAANRLVLAQLKVDAKSNEITGLPALLDLLDVKGCVVTIDAMGCQTAIAQTIVDKEADYVLAVKANQERLYERLQEVFAGAQAHGFRLVDHDVCEMVEKAHQRVEIRRCTIIREPYHLKYADWTGKWPHLRSVGMIESERHVDGQRTFETRYFISTLSGDARELLNVVRTHWGIENQAHWVLDVVFAEDDSRVRTGNAPQNLAVLRRLALNLLRRETTSKRSINGRRLQAAWREDYLLKVLAA